MQQYYYLAGSQQVGPFSPEQFRQQPVGPATLVWTPGMADWKKRADVPEINALFVPQQPASAAYTQPQPAPPQQPLPYAQPQPMYGQGTTRQIMPKTWLVESILVTLFCCLPFGVVGIINASRVDSRYRMGDSQGAFEASNEAGRWTKIGFFVAIGLWVLYFGLIFFGVLAGIGSTMSVGR